MASSPPMSMFNISEEYMKPEFVTETEDKHHCIKCNQMLRPPVKMLQCGHRMCGECVAEAKQSGVVAKCPGREEDCDQTNLFDNSHIFPDKGTERELKRLLVYCKNRAYGCKETLMWSKLEEHLKSCLHKPIVCPNSKLGCRKTLTVNTIEAHKSVCDYRPVGCKHCSQIVTQREINEGHENQCASKPKMCPFASIGCGFTGLKEDLEDHVKNTGHSDHIKAMMNQLQEFKRNESSVKDLVNKLQNENENLRKTVETVSREKLDIKQKLEKKIQAMQKMTATNSEDIEEIKEKLDQPIQTIPHLQTASESHERRIKHLETKQVTNPTGPAISGEVMAVVKKTEQSINMHDIRLAELDLRFQCLETTSHNGTLIWKISDYQRRKKEASSGHTISLYSQPFYTSKYGYKMCGRIYLYGDGMGKGSHLSLFFVVMKGEYDSLLPWPFKQRVTLSLLDQENGSRNLSDTFKPDPTSSSFKKPLSEMNVASGCPLFVAQNVAETSKYLKNDTIFIKISVDTQDLPV